MDIPTYIIIFSFLISVLVFSVLKLLRVLKTKLTTALFLTFLGVWAFITALGELMYNFAGNNDCSKYLGCVTGFGGYDAFEHFFFGIVFALAIIWLGEHFSKYSILNSENWKTVVIVIALVALFGVLWELLEFSHDALRSNVLHEVLYNFRLHINLLDQPTNVDTMGDLFSGIFGAIVGLFLLS